MMKRGFPGPARFLRSSLVAVPLAGLAISAPALAAGETANVWLTRKDLSQALQPQGNVVFGADASAGQTTIYVDEKVTYQTMDGIGASLTDSSAWLIKNKLSAANQTAVMTKLFDPVNGIGVSWLRQPMGASDFSSRGNYSYDDMPAGQRDDTNLSRFSLAHDQQYIIPLVKQALSLNPQLKVMISPWSPPGWMKANDSMNGGTLNTSAYGQFALYFAKTIKGYEAAGVPIYALTIQNEPLHQTSGYPTMYLPAAEANNFIKYNLGPTLANQGLKTKVLGYDHNWDQPGYIQTLYSDASTYGYLAGSAWHFYGGNVETMSDIHYQYPEKDVYFTEGSSGTWITNLFEANITNEISIFRNWAKTYTDWNIALDTNRGPINGGCATCLGLVTINQSTGQATYTSTYYAMGHISKFVVPGAKRIASTGFTKGLFNVAFKNPDGSKSLIVYNQNGANTPFAVKWGNASFNYTIPATSIVTFKWAGTQATDTAIRSSERLQASSYHEGRGVRLEATTDAGGGQAIGFTSSGSFLRFENVDLTNVTSVSARVANGGSNTTIELRADSVTGPLLGTVAANVTGGWQTWVTNTASLTGASGVRDLFVVFRGSTNLNWLQFGGGSTPPPTGNLLANPGFEEGSLSGWSDWHPTTQAAAAHQVDSDTPRASSFKLTHYASGAYQQTTYQGVSVPNGTYRASVWVRSGGGQKNLRLEVSNHGGGTTLYSTDLGATAYPSTWTQLTINNIAVTSGTVTVGIHSNANAGNWAAFDDVELTRQ
ncbi:carbohydrate-binding protein [Stigmatella aurantiaca]|uniref:Glycoside hydrolase family 30 protein n=1 Tax=Stigmatella aurantiaca (strain DW4/3-1) TaxID=378806 RepID=Q09DH4_STIAD|nr:carbohydrate-binding protein [Stigmatella aurantiaca]ADO69338.1 Glycoside hydrolase family 30 protein [Stigmatella aurantiaca DW4/3-1]EAU69814.1 putative glycosyl hydrolase [Stigmatella aurantiaca DW4/3-1]